MAEAPTVEVSPDWQTNSAGHQYVPARGRSGVIFRQGEESVEEARARDEREQGQGERPRRKKAPPLKGKKPPAPTQIDLKQLEHHLAQGLKAPGMLCAGMGDDWGLRHFTKPGLGGADYLARNLVAAAQYNPWLREQLEKAVTGEAFAVKLITSFSLAAAVFAYAAPPIIYYANLPFPETGRELLEIPPRRAQPFDFPDASTAETNGTPPQAADSPVAPQPEA